VSLLSAKEGKAGEAIWTMEHNGRG